MSDDGNKTVFRPSPLKGGGQKRQSSTPAPADGGWGAPPPPSAPPPGGGNGGGGGWDMPPPPPPPSPGGGNPFDPLGGPQSGSQPTGTRAFAVSPADMVPNPDQPREDRNPLLAYSAPVLSMVAALQSGRWQVSLQEFHQKASEAIGKFEKAIANLYPEAVRQRATYAVCATVDDVAQNLPGAERERTNWAQNNMQVIFFKANIGGDRFWNLVKEMVSEPRQNAPLIELYHACLAAGFEGRLRTTADGAGKKQEVMASLYGALEHVRSLSQHEIVTHWKGTDTPRKPINFWTIVALAAACAAGILLLLYTVLFLILLGASEEPETRIANLFPSAPVTLNRSAAVLPPPPSSTQTRLREFLASEIANGQVEVDKDRVRTTVGTLFASASDQLTGNNAQLFRKIGQAIELEPGPVKIEGHADSDRLNPTIEFPNNLALSEARARTVAQIIAGELSNPGRVSAAGIGDTRPIASNDTADGKARNRRVEIVLDLSS